MAGVTVKGLNDALQRLDINKYEKQVQFSLNAFAEDVTIDAKKFAPVDEGHLRQSINNTKGKLSITIDVNADYAAYMEFGTRKFAAIYVASLPPDWQAFASQYKGGGGGSFNELVERITAWIERTKYLPKEAAYAVELKILREGIKSHPFLYPAFEKNRQQLINDINAIEL